MWRKALQRIAVWVLIQKDNNMLDPKRLRTETEQIRKGLKDRSYPLDFLERFLEVDVKWREERQRLDELVNKRNTSMPKGKPTPEQLEALKVVSEEIKALQEQVNVLEADVSEAALYLPNIPDPVVTVGKSEDDNKVIRTWGEPREFSFTPKAHDELGVNAGILDFDSAAKITGARFAIYRGLGARLERALISYMLEVHTQEHGYEELMPPVIVHSDSLRGTGQLPKFSEDCFRLADTDYWLSPTAEVQLTNVYKNSVIEESKLPILVTGHTPCFRKEAGSYGRDMKGIIRQHQFNKIELVQLVKPEESMQALDRLLQHAETILQRLGLPYRVVELCTGDLGFSSAKTYDLEVWFPSQNKYREISSCSCFLDFQARRAMIRYKDSQSGKVQYLHTLNGSGVAVGRAFAAILENYQQPDGSIFIPEVLQKMVGTERITCLV